MNQERVKLEQKLFSITGTKVAASGYNPHYKSRYSSYRDILDVVMPLCKKHELVFTLSPAANEHGTGVTLDVTDLETGYTKSATLVHPVTTGTNGEQTTGKHITYLKRIALIALFGLEVDEDRSVMADGEDPEQYNRAGTKKREPKPAPQAAPKEKTTKEKIAMVAPLLKNLDDVKIHDLFKKLGKLDGSEKFYIKAANFYADQWKVRSVGFEDHDVLMEIHNSIVDQMVAKLKEQN